LATVGWIFESALIPHSIVILEEEKGKKGNVGDRRNHCFFDHTVCRKQKQTGEKKKS